MSNGNTSTTEDSHSSTSQSISSPENNSFANARITEIKPEEPVSVAKDKENGNTNPDASESEDGKQDVKELERKVTHAKTLIVDTIKSESGNYSIMPIRNTEELRKGPAHLFPDADEEIVYGNLDEAENVEEDEFNLELLTKCENYKRINARRITDNIVPIERETLVGPDPSEGHLLRREDNTDNALQKEGTFYTNTTANEKATLDGNVSSSSGLAVLSGTSSKGSATTTPGAFAVENPMYNRALQSRLDSSSDNSIYSNIRDGAYTDAEATVSIAVPTSSLPEQTHDDPEDGHHRVVRAVCVEDQEVIEAKVISRISFSEPRVRVSRGWYCIALTLLPLVAIVTTLSVVLTKKSKVTEINEDRDEVITPSEKIYRVEKLRAILAPLNADDVLDENSPEFSSDRRSALDWLVMDDWLSIDTMTDWKIRQRYIVALFYFSTNGSAWKDQLSFLSDRDECDWIAVKTTDTDTIFYVKGIICNGEGQVEVLRMEGNNLSGTIPPELSHFSDSIMELDIGGGTLSGSIPLSFENFKILEVFKVNDHCLSGDIPDLSPIQSIHTFSVENNDQLSGSLNGFCNGSEYKNAGIDIVRSTCGSCLGQPKSSLIECDCCSCCNEDDFACCDEQDNNSCF